MRTHFKLPNLNNNHTEFNSKIDSMTALNLFPMSKCQEAGSHSLKIYHFLFSVEKVLAIFCVLIILVEK